MRHFLVLVACCVFSSIAVAQTSSEWLAGLPQTKDYVQKRASSYDRSGGNADYRKIAPGDTLVLMDEAGPGEITHFWTTMWADGQALKALVLRMYWDEEKTPSVESPLGDFFGLGLGDYGDASPAGHPHDAVKPQSAGRSVRDRRMRWRAPEFPVRSHCTIRHPLRGLKDCDRDAAARLISAGPPNAEFPHRPFPDGIR